MMRIRPAKPRRSASMRWPTTSLAHHSPAAGCQATTRSGSAPSSALSVAMAASRRAATSDGVSGKSIWVSPALDVGDDRGRLFVQRALERGGQFGVVLVAHGEDAALRDLARQVLQQLRQRLLRDALGERVVDVDLPIAHGERVQRARVLLRHVDAEVEVAQRRRQKRLHAPDDLVGLEEALALADLELVQDLLPRDRKSVV